MYSYGQGQDCMMNPTLSSITVLTLMDLEFDQGVGNWGTVELILIVIDRNRKRNWYLSYHIFYEMVGKEKGKGKRGGTEGVTEGVEMGNTSTITNNNKQ